MIPVGTSKTKTASSIAVPTRTSWSGLIPSSVTKKYAATVHMSTPRNDATAASTYQTVSARSLTIHVLQVAAVPGR